MSLSTTDSRFVYDGDGTTTEFSFPRKIIEAAHLDVWLYDEDDDSYALQTLNTHYTFAGSGLSNGIYASATITFTTAPGSDKKVVLYRDPSLVQEADFSGETNVLNALNRFADRVTMQMQRMQDQIDRTIKLPDGDYAPSWGNTGTKADYANALLGFDSSGAPMPSGGSSGDVAVSPAMTPVVQAATLELASEAFGIMEVWAEWFGASPSATAAVNAVALQAWIDRCAATGKIGRIGPGVFLTNATIIMKDGARLRGSGHFNWARTAYAYTDSNPTVIKNDGTLTGTNSVVFRCSQMPVGQRGTDFSAPGTSDLQNIEVSDIHFDAHGAQYAAYYYRCGGESLVHRVSHSGATVAGFFLGGIFAATGWHLSTMLNTGLGYLIGQDTADTNLTDEAACNAVEAIIYTSRNTGGGGDGKIARASHVKVISENNGGPACILRQTGADSSGAHWEIVYTEGNTTGPIYYGLDGNGDGLHNVVTLGYRHRGTATLVKRAPFYGDGSTPVYTLTGGAGITAANLYVYKNGIRQTATSHYTVADSGSDLDVIFVAAPTATERVFIHGNTGTTLKPEVFTLEMRDSSTGATPVVDGGSTDPSTWVRVRGPANHSVSSYINSNTRKYHLEGHGRADAQTSGQFIYRAPFRLDPWILAQSAAAVSHTGDTNETTLATITVPANVMGANGRVRVTTTWNYTDSTNSKTLRVSFGGTNHLSAATSSSGSDTARFVTEIANRNDVASQVSGGGANGALGFSSSNLVTSTVNTTLDVTVLIKCVLANSGETVTLDGYMVEVLPGL